MPISGWQLLGELELPVRAGADDAIRTWLAELLDPLQLHADFLNRILQSAQDAAGRALRAEGVIGYDHIHFMLHAPKDHESNGGTWGFFRVEKIGDTAQGMAASAHSIEFYLYLEKA